MAKLLVKVTGQFMLYSTADGIEIDSSRPYVVPACNFCDTFAALGRLSILRTELPDSATDKEWKEFWKSCKGDLELAIASYMSTFEVEGEPKPAPKPAKSHRTKKAHD